MGVLYILSAASSDYWMHSILRGCYRISQDYLITKGGSAEDSERITKKDMPYVLGMILPDIIALILLMFGLIDSASANASLLNNFDFD